MRLRTGCPAILPRLAFACVLVPLPSSGQATTAAEVSQERNRPIAVAIRRSGEVQLDGAIEESAWAAAPPVTAFTQQRPDEGAPATERTEVRFLFDEEAIYIGARMFDSAGKAGVVGRLTRRDQVPQSDLLRIDFDPYRDRLNAVQLEVSPSGWRGDASASDRSWDPVWQAATRVDSAGWTAEIRIPLSQLRFSRDSVQTWGLQLTRTIERKNERAQWSFWRQNEPGGPAFFGDLEGLQVRSRPSGAEFLPYTVVRTQRLSSGDPESPFYDPRSSDFRVGADLKYLLTSNLTLSGTVNPDFGQVEVDPAVVNLTAFETFYSERRPFFVEGADLFRFGRPGCNMNCDAGLNLFYSRRIGRTPQGGSLARDAGDFADLPENTTILGAAKVTGRSAAGYTVGLMNAVTRLEVAEVATEDGRRLFQSVEPLTNYFVGRVRREMREGSLVLGGIATSVNRDLDDGGLASLLATSAQSFGLDGEYAWGRRTYRLQVAISGSQVTGDPAAIRRLQRSSARYLQRPDREVRSNRLLTFGYDPTADVLRGYAIVSRLEKAGGNWLWDVNARGISPGFDSNDLGFQQTADWLWVNGTLGRQFTRPTSYFRSLMVMGGGQQQWNYDGDRTGGGFTGFSRIEFLNYWTAALFLTNNFSYLSDRLTRGGPVVRQAGNVGGGLNVGTDPRRLLLLRGNISAFYHEDGGSSFSGGLSLTLRPASNASITLGPTLSRMRSTEQYVTSVPDSTASSFYGRRYVFAHLDQAQLSMVARASVTFTPDLSLEAFAQPLLASADYTQFQEFETPRKAERVVYGRDTGTIASEVDGGKTLYRVDPDGVGPASTFTFNDPNFSLRSLRGTGVLRWEWRPGSTLFLVWTQSRSGREALGDLKFVRDGHAMFSAKPDNILLLKVSYWLGL